MVLKAKIQDDLKTALKGKKEIETATLRMLNAAILNKEKEKRAKLAKSCDKELTEKELIEKSQLTDGEIIEAVSSEVKKRREAIFEFEKGGRKDLAEKEKKEIEFLKKYLPEQLPEESVKKIIEEAIEKIGAKEIRDMGKVMAEVIPSLKGKAEGSLISKIVKKLLTSAK